MRGGIKWTSEKEEMFFFAFHAFPLSRIWFDAKKSFLFFCAEIERENKRNEIKSDDDDDAQASIDEEFSCS